MRLSVLIRKMVNLIYSILEDTFDWVKGEYVRFADDLSLLSIGIGCQREEKMLFFPFLSTLFKELCQ